MIGKIVVRVDSIEEYRHILKNFKLGYCNLGPGIGDHVYYTFFPEIYYNNTGKKLVDVQNKWIFDFNPFIERNKPVDIVIDPWSINSGMPKDDFLSNSDMIFKALGYENTLRLPRLYKYENSEKIPQSICINTNGKSVNFVLPDSIIDYMHDKYKNYTIFQIGGKEDRSTPFIDKRGLGMWESAELISKCEMFIGVDSGMYHIAHCYPSVWKKVVLNRPVDELKKMYLMSTKQCSEWLDCGTMYFNCTENDIGTTHSYKKL